MLRRLSRAVAAAGRGCLIRQGRGRDAFRMIFSATASAALRLKADDHCGQIGPIAQTRRLSRLGRRTQPFDRSYDLSRPSPPEHLDWVREPQAPWGLARPQRCRAGRVPYRQSLPTRAAAAASDARHQRQRTLGQNTYSWFEWLNARRRRKRSKSGSRKSSARSGRARIRCRMVPSALAGEDLFSGVIAAPMTPFTTLSSLFCSRGSSVMAAIASRSSWVESRGSVTFSGSSNCSNLNHRTDMPLIRARPNSSAEAFQACLFRQS